MAEKEVLETFTERFVRLTAGLSRKELGQILDLTPGAVLKLLNGDTQSLKAHGAIALARRLGVSVEYLAYRGPLPRNERDASLRLFADGLRPGGAAETEPPYATRTDLKKLDDDVKALRASLARLTRSRRAAVEENLGKPATPPADAARPAPRRRRKKAG